MAAPLLGLASILGREYAYTRPTYKEQDDILKILSPQTYYTNQLINYLTDKFGVRSSLPSAQNTIEQASREFYGNGPQGIDIADEERQIEEIKARANSPAGIAAFENNMRDMEYGTVDPIDPQYVGPQTEDSQAFQYGSDTFPVTVGQLPSESNFTPRQLEVLEQMLLGKNADMGPQPDAPDTPRRPDFTPESSGSGYMPQDGGYGKNAFDVQQEYEQYLRGGLIQRRR